jgi:hypothetical protein
MRSGGANPPALGCGQCRVGECRWASLAPTILGSWWHP